MPGAETIIDPNGPEPHRVAEACFPRGAAEDLVTATNVTLVEKA